MSDELQYRLAFGYAACAALGWGVIGFLRLQRWQNYLAVAAQRLEQAQTAAPDLLQALQQERDAILRFGGSLAVDGGYAVVVALIFAFIAFKLRQATWNGWDWATAITGGAAVLSLLLLCARGRVMAIIPLTLFPLWGALYLPGLKRACGVGDARAKRLDELVQEPEVDAGREQVELDGLRQSLRVFELERGMDTSSFVTRYIKGLEDDTPDNQEWFALARLARRAEDRIKHGGDPAASV